MEPPFTGEAVNVIVVPEQTLFWSGAMVIDGVREGVMVIAIGLVAALQFPLPVVVSTKLETPDDISKAEGV